MTSATTTLRLLGFSLGLFLAVAGCSSLTHEGPIFQRSAQLERSGGQWSWNGKLETGQRAERPIAAHHVQLIRRVEQQVQTPEFAARLVDYLESCLAQQFDTLPVGGVAEVAGLVNLRTGHIEPSRPDPSEQGLRDAILEWVSTGKREAFAKLLGILDAQLTSITGFQLVTRTSPRLRQFLALYQSRVQGKPLDWYAALNPSDPRLRREMASLGPMVEEAASAEAQAIFRCRIAHHLAMCLLRLWATQEEDYKLRERANAENWHFHIHANPFPPSEGDVRIAAMEQQPHFVIVPVIRWSPPPGAWEMLRDLFAGVPLRLQVWVAVEGGCARLENEAGRWLQIQASPKLTTLWGSLIAMQNLWTVLPRYDLAELSHTDWRHLEQLIDLIPALIRELPTLDASPRSLGQIDQFLTDVLNHYLPASTAESALAMRLRKAMPTKRASSPAPSQQLEWWETRFWHKLANEIELGIPQSIVRRVLRVESLVRLPREAFGAFPLLRGYVGTRQMLPEDRLAAFLALRFNIDAVDDSLIGFDVDGADAAPPDDDTAVAIRGLLRLRWPADLQRDLLADCRHRAAHAVFADYLVTLWSRLAAHH